MNLKIYEKTKCNSIYKQHFHNTYEVDPNLEYDQAEKKHSQF